jgi:hypothetical protein
VSGWLAGWLVGWLAGWLAGWLVSRARLSASHLLKGLQLELDALEDVHVVDAHEDGAPAELRGELAAPPGSVGPREHVQQARGLDARRHDLHADVAAVVLDEDRAAARAVLEAEHARAAGEEVARVVEGVEADEVRVEQRAEDLLAARKGAEDLG